MHANLKRSAHACVLCVASLLLASQASANILDDIKALARAARDRAAEARDRAAVARDRAIAARDSAEEVLGRIEETESRLTEAMRNFADEAIEDVQRLLEESMAGRADFVADGGCSLAVCEPFRQDMITLFERMEAIVNTLYDIAGMTGMHANYQRSIDMVRDLPGHGLFPIYRLLGKENSVLTAELLDRLSEVLDELEVVRDALDHERAESNASREVGETHLDSELESCTYWNETAPREWDVTAGIVDAGIAILMKTVAAGIQGLGTFVSDYEMDAGTVAVNGKFSSDPVDIHSDICEAVAEPAFWAANFVRSQARYCSTIAIHGNVRDAIIDGGRARSRGDARAAPHPGSRVSTLDNDEENEQFRILRKLRAIQSNERAIHAAVRRMKGGDLNNDGAVDLEDYAAMQGGFTGP